MLLHRFAIADPSQKFEEHHQTTERGHRPLGLAQFHFLPAPKSGNFPVHCFVLLGVSSNQLKHYRVRTKQCYLISGFRFRRSVSSWARQECELEKYSRSERRTWILNAILSMSAKERSEFGTSTDAPRLDPSTPNFSGSKHYRPNSQQLLFANRRGRPYSANELREKRLRPLLVTPRIPLGG